MSPAEKSSKKSRAHGRVNREGITALASGLGCSPHLPHWRHRVRRPGDPGATPVVPSDTTPSPFSSDRGSTSATDRLCTLLRKPVFRRGGAGRRRRGGTRRTRATASGGGRPGLDSVPAADLDVVIHSASSVSRSAHRPGLRDEPRGAVALYTALRGGSRPHVVHVSTAYVGGIRKGIVPEARPATHSVDWQSEFGIAARDARVRVEMSFTPAGDASSPAGEAGRARKEGPQAVGEGRGGR
jgi:hypothetical protein